MDFDEVIKLVRSGKSIEEVLSLVDWKEFESSVEEIFKSHNFKTKRNFRFKTKKRFEIDVVAEKRDLLFIVDCKQWGKGRYKTNALKKAAEKNWERAKEMQNTLMGKNKKVIPIIITLFDEAIYDYHGVYIVPVYKLNSFLLEF